MRCLNRSSVESYVSTDDGLDNNEISDPTGGGGMCAIETTPSPSARQPIVAKLRERSADQILKTAAGPTWTRGSGAAELPTTHENVSRNGARGDGMRCLLTGGPVRSCPRSSPTKRASQYSNRSIATPSPLPQMKVSASLEAFPTRCGLSHQRSQHLAGQHQETAGQERHPLRPVIVPSTEGTSRT